MNSFRRDLVCSFVLLVIAGGYFAAASRIGSTALSDAVGAGGLPRVYGAVLAVLAIIIGIGALLRRHLVSNIEPDDGTGRTLHRLTRAAITVAAGVLYLSTVGIIGYPFAIALLITGMSVYQGERLSWRTVLTALLGAAALYVLFEIVLGVTLPAPWND